MSFCPRCGAKLPDGARECFQCHAFIGALTPGEIRREARRGSLQGTLIAVGSVIVIIIGISMLIEAIIR